MSWIEQAISNVKTSASFNYSELQNLGWQAQLALNLGLALPGVAVWWYFDGLVAFAGVAWALLNTLPIVQWVLRV